MIKYIFPLLLIFCISCRSEKAIIRDNVCIKIYPYEDANEMRASAMPELKADSELMRYRRRLEYLLINVPEIHLPEKAEQRNEIWNLFPDTTKLKRLYLNKYIQDKKLAEYFGETFAPINDTNLEITKTYTVDELMEVASKFFYCDKIFQDTTVQAHVCVGLNGIKEANWDNDYTLLEAFCYEAIFNDFDKDSSKIWTSFSSLKDLSVQKYKAEIKSLDQYLENVKLELFDQMKKDEVLKEELLAYYELNKNNLAFKIKN
ncbi:MAG: hypothetical protein QNK23_13220 [Crocinitomicaceae bacterium]|nr:hypothetical protein [Crocinitomicaceae bacterium]